MLRYVLIFCCFSCRAIGARFSSLRYNYFLLRIKNLQKEETLTFIDQRSVFAIGRIIQKGVRLLILRSTPLRPPRLSILLKGVKRLILFLYIKDRRQNLPHVLPILMVVWKDAIALYSCFELCKETHTTTFWREKPINRIE